MPTTSLEGWHIGSAEDVDWAPWGEHGDARAKVLAHADGYFVAVVEADEGYTGTPHEHEHTEFLYVLDGTLRNQGRTMQSGDAYAASMGSTHVDFVAETPSAVREHLPHLRVGVRDATGPLLRRPQHRDLPAMGREPPDPAGVGRQPRGLVT